MHFPYAQLEKAKWSPELWNPVENRSFSSQIILKQFEWLESGSPESHSCVCVFWVFPSFHGTGWEQSHMTTVTSGSGSRDDYSAALWELILQGVSLSPPTVHTGMHRHTQQALQAHACTHAQIGIARWQSLFDCHLNLLGIAVDMFGYANNTKRFISSRGSCLALRIRWQWYKNLMLIQTHTKKQDSSESPLFKWQRESVTKFFSRALSCVLWTWRKIADGVRKVYISARIKRVLFKCSI